MIAEERLGRIAEIVARRGTASVSELARALDASESTIRRDLDKLDQARRLVKVHGGAAALGSAHITHDVALPERHGLNVEEKRAVAAYAVSLIGPDDFVYLDAGSTVEELVNLIEETRALYATDAVSHAMKLASKGCRVVVLGGELKSLTEALVGPDALAAISRYHFTLGFWGTNGVTPEGGFTTPDRNEAMVKQTSMERCARRYVLADASKLGATSLVTFADFGAATLVTSDRAPMEYRMYENVVEVSL